MELLNRQKHESASLFHYMDEGNLYMTTSQYNSNLFKELSQGIRLGFAVVDSSYRIQHWNQWLETHTGIKQEEAVGKGLFELYPEMKDKGMDKYLATVLSSGRPVMLSAFFHDYFMPITVVHENSDQNMSQSTRILPLSVAGETYGAMILIEDVTDHVLHEKQRSIMEKKVRQTMKMQSLGTFAGGIAHNFNNILSIVIGNMELAMETMPERLKEKEFIADALFAAQRAAKLSTMMLQFVGQGKPSFKKMELGKTIREMFEILRPQIPHPIEVSIKENTQNFFIEGDIAMIRQVVGDLAINASEAIGDKKGSITIDYGQRFYPEEELQRLSLQGELPQGEYVYFTIKDNGPGMTPAVAERAFEPFFSTKFTGRGMGLATTHGTMLTHQGSVFLDSVQGKGTTAYVIFPAAAPEIISLERPASAVPGKGQKNYTVLIAEDEPTLLHFESRLLTRAGHSIHTACDGIEALEIFEKYREAIDIILLDFSMPRLDGIETLKIIRKKSNVPAILLTGYSIENIGYHLNGVGNVFLMQKPFANEDLKNKILEMVKTSSSE